tara:strand:- start:3447 stop:7559 length:4113 start_codon:yes stop_codon:yes gene_type:complete
MTSTPLNSPLLGEEVINEEDENEIIVDLNNSSITNSLEEGETETGVTGVETETGVTGVETGTGVEVTGVEAVNENGTGVEVTGVEAGNESESESELEAEIAAVKAKYKTKRDKLLEDFGIDPEFDPKKPYKVEKYVPMEDRDQNWFEQLTNWAFFSDADIKKTAILMDQFEAHEIKLLREKYAGRDELGLAGNIKEALVLTTNIYTEDVTRGLEHEVERWNTPAKALTRLPYAGLRVTGVPQPAADFVYLGSADAITGAIQNVADWDWNHLQKVPGFQGLMLLDEEYKKGSYVDKGFGWTDELQRTIYTNMGIPDPALWSEEEVQGMEMRSTVMLNIAVGLMTMGAGNLVMGSSTLRTAAPWLVKSARWLNPTSAKTFMGGISRLSIINALDEIPVTALDRNESGSAASFMQMLGIDFWDGVDPSTKAGLTKWEAAQAAYLPNVALSTFFVGVLNAVPISQAVKNADKLDFNFKGSLGKGETYLERFNNFNDQLISWVEQNFNQTYRAFRSRDKFYRRQGIRDAQESIGLIQRTTDGAYRQGELLTGTNIETKTGQIETNVKGETKLSADDAEKALKEKHGLLRPEQAIESDTLEESLTTASNRQLEEINTRSADGEGIIQVTNEVLERQPIEKEFPSTEKFNLVEEVSEEGLEFELEFINDLEKEQLDELLKDRKILARIKTLTGKSPNDPWVDIDRIDIAKALKDLQEKDGLIIQRTPDVYEEAMANVRRINESLKVEKGETSIEKIDTRGFEQDDILAYNRLVNAIDKAIGSEWKGGLDSAGDVLNVLNVARVTAEEGVQRALRDFRRVTTSLSGRRLNVTEQIPGARFVLNQARKDRRELLNGITRRALERGEARPPSTTLPTTPEPGNFNSEKVVDDLLNARFNDDVVAALDNEARLIEQNGKLDAAMEADSKIAERRLTDYESKTYEQKKAEGEILPKKTRTKEEIIDQQRRMDASPAAKRGRKRIEPGTPHPTDKRKIRGYDGRWVTRQYFNQQTAARKAAEGGGGIQQSNIGPDVDFTGGNYNERQVRQQLMQMEAGEKISKNQHLMKYGAHIDETLIGRIQQSKQLADEAKEALRDAYKISGLLPERIKYLDEIDSMKMFGLDENIASIAEWSPVRATFMARNPNDPLVRVASGESSGLFSPDQWQMVHRSSIYLALHPNLAHRLGGLRGLDGISPRWFGVDASHESFHAIQQWLDFLGATKYQEALTSKKGLAEMVEIIKKGGGNYREGMSAFEIQAEAFGVWLADRKIKLKSGPIKSSFERLKMFLSSLRRKINIIRKKDPSFIDVFELAANGDIARKGLIKQLTPAQLEGLVPRIDAAIDAQMPELTMRIFNHLEAKKLAYDDLMGRNNSKFYKGGCT